MKKGFTLIELLAVIVILAIIATIAVPIVLSIIEDAKESTTLRNAEYYLDAVEQSIAKKSLNVGTAYQPKECEVQEEGNLLCDGEVEVIVEVKGKKPSNGTITFEEGKMINISLEIENKVVTQNEKNELVIGESNGENNSICTLKEGEPNAIGSKYQCKVKDDMEEDFADGYYFYVLSHEEDGTTNLIMDRNINSDGTPTTEAITYAQKDSNGGIYNLVEWVSQADYNDDTNYGGGNNNKGPITAMNFLNNATSTWSNIPNLNLTYDDEGENFTNFKVTGKARLLYEKEMNDRCADGCPVWLVDYLSVPFMYENIPQIENPTNISGYWIFASAHISPLAQCIFDTLSPSTDGVAYNNNGVRPVINVNL